MFLDDLKGGSQKEILCTKTTFENHKKKNYSVQLQYTCQNLILLLKDEQQTPKLLVIIINNYTTRIKYTKTYILMAQCMRELSI